MSWWQITQLGRDTAPRAESIESAKLAQGSLTRCADFIEAALQPLRTYGSDTELGSDASSLSDGRGAAQCQQSICFDSPRERHAQQTATALVKCCELLAQLLLCHRLALVQPAFLRNKTIDSIASFLLVPKPRRLQRARPDTFVSALASCTTQSAENSKQTATS